jgi:hypothetical protein
MNLGKCEPQPNQNQVLSWQPNDFSENTKVPNLQNIMFVNA